MASLDAQPATSDLSFEDVGSDNVHPDFPFKQGDLVCLRTPLEPNYATRFYVDVAGLARQSRVMRDMFEVIKESDGNKSVIQMREDSSTLELVCRAVSEDAKGFPDLLQSDVKTLLGLFAASLKYDMPLLQVFAEHAIRVQLKSDSSEIKSFDNLRKLFDMAGTFDRELLVCDVAKVAAKLAPALSSRELSVMLLNVNNKSLLLLVEELLACRKAEHRDIRMDLHALMNAVGDRFGHHETMKCAKINEVQNRIFEALR